MEKKPKMKFRSISDLLGYNDNEKDFGPSMADPSQDEPISALVARMMRGEAVTGFQPTYDVPEGQDPAEAINNMSPVEKDGFDMSDAAAGAAVIRRVERAAKKGGTKTSPSAEKPQEGPVPVEKKPVEPVKPPKTEEKPV